VSVIITSVSHLSFLTHLQCWDPVHSALTVRTTKNVEAFKMLGVSVTWVSVSLLGTHSSGEVSVMSTMIVPAVTPTLDVRVRMGSATMTDSGSVTYQGTVTS